MPDTFERLKVIVLTARGLPADRRAAYLDETCAGDAPLRAEVEGLLAYDVNDVSVLSPGGAVHAITPVLTGPSDLHEPAPEAIGPYRIGAVLGEGGMGTVFRAEQTQPIRRDVALKLIRRGLDTDRIVSRFRAERQALALMDHPNIAKVLDAGATADGRPYFVMELVEGTPITRYCAARALSVRNTLNLFLAVCQGVQHAHQKGIIHRDLKPSNVLVRETDGAPTPKIIDFGIAKAVTGVGEEPLFTTQAGLMVGTPDYMSPEQAGVIAGGVDTRTDVYSLGILLCELLTGERPYRFTSYSPAEIHKVLADTEPLKPSTMVSTSASHAEMPDRGARPTGDRLRRQLAGDIDNIVLKSLAKRPGDRYESVEQLADDVRRHLSGLPILARPATWSYWGAKFVRRHTGGVAFAASLLILIVGAAVMFAFQAAWLAEERDRARDAERRAIEQATTAETVSTFLIELFRTSDPSEARGNSITAREILDRGAARIDAELRDTPAVQATLLGTMGRVYQSLGLFGEAQPLLERALERRRALYGPDHALVGESVDRLALLTRELGDLAAAEKLYREALDIMRGTIGPDHTSIGRVLNNLGNLLAQTDRLDEGEALLREALAMRIRLFGPEHADVAESTHDLGVALTYQGDLEGAEEHLRRALDLDRRIHGEIHPVVVIGWHSLGRILEDRRDFTGAEQAMRKSLDVAKAVYGDEHPDIAHAMQGLGEFLVSRGQLEAAEPLLRQSLDLHRRLVGAESTWVVASRHALARQRLKAGALDEAEKLLRQNLTLARKVYGERSVWIAATDAMLGAVYRGHGRLREAETIQRRAIEIFRMTRPNNQEMGGHLWDLANVVAKLGRGEEAEQLYRESLTARRKSFPAGDPEIAESLASLGTLLLDRGDASAAEPLLREAVDIYRQKSTPEDPTRLEAERALARAGARSR